MNSKKEIMTLIDKHVRSADSFFEEGEFEKAADEYSRARHLYHVLFVDDDTVEDTLYIKKEIELFQKIGDCYHKLNTQESIEDAKYEYFKSLVFSEWAMRARDIKMDDTIARIWYKIGLFDFQNGNLKLAEKNFLEAFEVYKKLIAVDFEKYYVLYANTATMLGDVYFAIGDDAVGATYKAISIDTLKRDMYLAIEGNNEEEN